MSGEEVGKIHCVRGEGASRHGRLGLRGALDLRRETLLVPGAGQHEGSGPFFSPETPDGTPDDDGSGDPPAGAH